MIVLFHERLQRVEGWRARWDIFRSQPVLVEVCARGVGRGELRSKFRNGEIVGVDLGVGDAREHLGFEGGFVVDAEAVDGYVALVWVCGLRGGGDGVCGRR